MKFSISSTALSTRLQAIGRVISAKNTLQILDCILFEIEDGKLKLTASDNESTLSTWIELLESSENGRFAIKAKTILDSMKEIPEQPLTFDINASTLEVIIYYQNGKYNLVGQNPDEYPTGITPVENITELSLSNEVVVNGINRAMFATASPDDERSAIRGIFFDLRNTQITIIATDGHKLVYSRTNIPDCNCESSFILNRKPANLLRSLVGKDEQALRIKYNDSIVEITSADFQMTSRLIEAKYPNYNAVIPTSNSNHLIIDRASLISALRRVLIFSSQSITLIKMQLENNRLTLSAQDIDFSMSAEESIVCEYSGMPMNIGFNGTTLLEMLSNISCDNVTFKLGDPSRAGVIVPTVNDEKEEILMLLMPIMLND